MSEHDQFYFSRPIAADEVNWPLANYRYGGIFPDSDIVHTGIDIDAPRSVRQSWPRQPQSVWTGYGLYSSADNEATRTVGGCDPHDFGYQGRQLYTVTHICLK
jgi:hypothetical protein